MLDTNIVSALMAKENRAVEQARRHSPSSLVLSALVAAEIEYGILRLAPGTQKRKILTRQWESLRELLREEPWTHRAAQIFGRMKVENRNRGEVIADWDVGIAAHAEACNAIVITRNTKYFAHSEKW